MTKPIVLLAAQLDFAVDYVASVLKKRDIQVIGPLNDMSHAIRVLLTEDLRGAVIMGAFRAEDRERLAEILARQALPCLMVRSDVQAEQDKDSAALFPPFAAFQVADWISTLA
ncbi:hypothetical protein ACQR50_06255 [Sphingomonas sp. Xoc002]|uniref:hypothetical protein n=1 Tax=Sphingomonas sp. Xoc002 TaxID=2837624 RepID=UPI003D16FFB5